MFDPFALVPTATPTTFDLPLPDGKFTSLLPQLPPSEYTNTNTGAGTKPEVDTKGAFDYFLSQARTDNAPLYEYGFEEERRYSNPYLQFNPKPLGGYDTEDIYANFQGSGEQLWNALVKAGATAGQSFVSSFSTFGSSIDAIRGGKPFDEDSVLGQTSQWLRQLENDYPNYYSQWEREHPFKSAIPFSGGFSNFWGDKVLKNVGFTIGSLGSSFLVDAGIELATAGAATPASFILAANQIKRAVSPLKNAFRNLSKTAALNKVDDLAGVARVGNGINDGLKTLNSAYNFKKGLQFAATTYFAAQGEAMIEGYQNYWDTRAKLYEQELDKGNITVDKIQEIEDIAQQAANTTATLNLPVIMASNLLQFPTLFGGKNILKQFDSPFLDIVNKEGLTVVNNYSRKQAWVNTMKELTKDFVTEGGEEGYQYYVGNSIHDYYVDKFNGTASNSLSEYLKEQLPKTVQDEKFWESVVIGGLAGGLMGGFGSIKKNLIGANARTEKAAQSLQNTFERYNSTIKDYVHFAENVEHSQDNDSVKQFHTAHKNLFSTIHDSLKYGIYENFQDNLEDLKNLPVEEYNKLFKTEFNEDEKLNHLNSIQSESGRIKDDLTQVNKFFQKNPFDSPYVNQRLRDLFKVDQTQIDNIKVKLFEDFKELTSYNISRLRNTRNRISEIEEELKTIGLDEAIIPVLYNLDSSKGANQYKRFKAVQLSALKDQVEYYKELDQPVAELNMKVKSLEKLIGELDKYTKELDDNQKESLRQLIFKEELGSRQLLREEEFQAKQEELIKQQNIATKVSEELQDQTNKTNQKVKEQVETVAKIVPKEEKKVEEPKAPNNLNLFNKNFASLSPGDKFYVALSTEEGEFTVVTKTPFVATKDGVSYMFTPSGVIKYENGEQRLRYALDNIGVRKVEQTEPVEVSDPINNTEPETKEVEKPKVKKTISKQQQLKEAVSKLKTKQAPVQKDGIYLIEGDDKFAYRYVDENTVVPLKLSLKGNEVTYSGDMTKAIDKSISQGYLLDDQYIQQESKGVDITSLLKEGKEESFGIDITDILSSERLDSTEQTGGKQQLTLSQLSDKLKNKNKEDNITRLNKFINNEPISDNLKEILNWRIGKGINIDC